MQREYDVNVISFWIEYGLMPTCLLGHLFGQAVKYIEYDSSFSEEEKKQAKALKVACNLNNAACKLKLKLYNEAEKLCTKVGEIEMYRSRSRLLGFSAILLLNELWTTQTNLTQIAGTGTREFKC